MNQVVIREICQNQFNPWINSFTAQRDNPGLSFYFFFDYS